MVTCVDYQFAVSNAHEFLFREEQEGHVGEGSRDHGDFGDASTSAAVC